MNGIGVFKRALLFLGVSSLLIGVVAQAQATFTGRNGQIAFRRYFNAEQTEGAIFTINPNGTGVRQITFPPRDVLDTAPDVSPDGTKVAFHRQRLVPCPQCISNDIHVVNVDGSNVRRLTRCTGRCLENDEPTWSPDGRRIAFHRFEGPILDNPLRASLGAIFIMRADGTHIRQVTQKRRLARTEDLQPEWSPDGRRLVFVRVNILNRPRNHIAIFTVQIDGTHVRRLTPWSLNAGDHPDWSPDGREILFRSHVVDDQQSNLYTIHPDGTHLRKLTHFRDLRFTPLGSGFSPNGRKITYARVPATGGENADVFVMNRFGAPNVRNVTRSRIWDSLPDWGPARADDDEDDDDEDDDGERQGAAGR